MAMASVDVAVVGRVSPLALAAASLGSMAFYSVSISIVGVLLGLDTTVSQAHGAGDRAECDRQLMAGIWLALLLTPAAMLAVWALVPVLAWAGVDPAVLSAARPYINALNWSTPFLFLYFALRRYIQGLHVVAPVMWTLVAANLVNLVGNWVFVFGHLGFPALGVTGSGWSTFVGRVFLAGCLGLVAWKLHQAPTEVSWAPDWKRIGALIRVGLPAAGQMAAEVAVFGVVTTLVARTGAATLAGHQIALTTVSTTFMMPLGISAAAAVRVGFGIGADDGRAAARSGWTALGLGAIAMSAAAAVLFFFPEPVARIYSTEPAVIAGAVTILRIAAFFQLFDGLQVVATGALRGKGDTHTPMLCHFVAYWVIGLPLGAWLCFSKGLGAPGLWGGLSLALILIGITLTLVWRRAARQLQFDATIQKSRG